MHIFIILFLFKLSSSDAIINTSSGPIQGVPSFVEDVEAFLGIPYAEPPVGELRFAKPVPKGKWQDVFKAANLPPPCVQTSVYPYNFVPDLTSMSEDCLYLNIWAPKSKNIHTLRPVIIFFHPGAFVTGSSNIKSYDGSNLASRGDVIFVTVNQRLGALGYLLTDTEEAKGSMAIYDQILAIKWIKENAKLFSGDPENIVLMGSSAGGCEVSAHLVSPLSQNLFKKAIVQSGSLVNPLFVRNSQLYESSREVAALVGCTNKTVSLKSDPAFVLKCLKSKPQEAFAAAEKILLTRSPTIFYPRIKDQFLPKAVPDLLHAGKFRKDVDLLVGINSEEGAFMLIVGMRDYLGDYGRNIDRMNKQRSLMIARGVILIGKESNPTEITKTYLRYVKDHTPIEYTKMVANLVGDYGIACSTVFLADLISRKGNSVYFYEFGFRAASTPMAEWVGPSHLDELQYVFGNPYYENFTSEEMEFSHLLIDRWSAFAKTGNPNIAGHVPWLRYSYDNPLYMHFGQEEESIRMKPNRRCEFWRKRFDAEIRPEFMPLSETSGKNAAETYPSKSLHIFGFMVFIHITYYFAMCVVM